MKIQFKKDHGKEYAFLKTDKKAVYLGPRYGVGEDEIENAVKALGLVEESFDLQFKKYEEIRKYLLKRIERASGSNPRDQ